MKLARLEVAGFKSFAKKTVFQFTSQVTSIVGPNGSGKSNVVESIRFVMGEQSMKSLRGKAGTDLIFKGSNALPKGSRASVTLVFDNRDHMLKFSHGEGGADISLDTDEVSITREVYPDGTNNYLINGTEVRLKDVLEVLASAFIGSKAHNIISQGEADHLLNAHPRERKELLEEALGLKLYHMRIKESERKLEKTRENLRESELLRRELAPHLKFLKKQVERIEAAKHTREELVQKAGEYLSQETESIKAGYVLLQNQKQTLSSELVVVGGTIRELEEKLSSLSNTSSHSELDHEKSALHAAERIRDDLSRQLGRIEGMIEFSTQSVKATPKTAEVHVAWSKIKAFIESTLKTHIAALVSATTIDEAKQIASDMRAECDSLLSQYAEAKEEVAPVEDKTSELIEQKNNLESQIAIAEEKVASLRTVIASLEASFAGSVETVRALEKDFREASVRESTLRQELAHLDMQYSVLKNREEAAESLRAETIALCGEEPRLVAVESTVPFMAHDALRTIERLKIRLEDLGGGAGGDVMREFNETEERDRFLEREITDATASANSLEMVIVDLKAQLAEQFHGGLKKVDQAFQELFTAMFGGGKAKLDLVTIEKRGRKKATEEGEEEIVDDEDDAPVEQGVEVSVQLPRKKTTEIEMLSGGERSLTSIALLFALTQVEPPPFLILDETDAALDEANSKRYADLLVQLSKHSQLIVVTHNRETMSAAQTLYGVTLGADDASTVLSVELEKAVQYAK